VDEKLSSEKVKAFNTLSQRKITQNFLRIENKRQTRKAQTRKAKPNLKREYDKT